MARYRRRHAPFVQVFKDAGTQVTIDNRLTLTELRVWCYLVFHCDWGNWVHVSQREMCHELGIDPGNMSRAMQTLQAEGLVIRDVPLEGVSWRYRIPSMYVHVGALEDVAWRQKRDIAQTQSAKGHGCWPSKAPSVSSRRASKGS